MATQTDHHVSHVGTTTPSLGKLTDRVVPCSPPTPESMSSVDIIDIREGNAVDLDLKPEISSKLRAEPGHKQLPTLLLYDEKGLQLFEQITYLDEYYLTNAEIDVLKRSATEIAQNIQSGSMVIELGSGNLRKISILLSALETAGKDIDYYALDLSYTELERTLAAVPDFIHVKCHGLYGTYDDGLVWLNSSANALRPKCIISLGSSIGNFDRKEAAAFLDGFGKVLRPCDSMLVGLDACNDPDKVYHAYNDRQGLTHKFILNGLSHANKILNEQVFNLDDWEVIGEFVHDAESSRHQAFYSPKRDVVCAGISIAAGERVKVEQSLKYSDEESYSLWECAGLRQVAKWGASTESYNVHMLVKQDALFHLDPAQYAVNSIPTIEDWRGLWAAWDTVTRGMIPSEELLNKPIKLRNACIFYLGHIPTFLDIQLVKATNEPLCEPLYYPQIFERGIDPDVDDPARCHSHSEIPDEWPPLSEILDYQGQVRAKVERMYASGSMSRKLGRSVWMGFEHEVMHLETLLYMLLQSDRTLPPPRTVRPDFATDAHEAAQRAMPNEWFTIPAQTLSIGLEDPEDNSGPDGPYGWDNEKPVRQVKVSSFEAKARPITNVEYAHYLQATNNSKIPASWATRNADGSNDSYTSGADLFNDVFVRTVYGYVPLSLGLHWPVFASYDELAGCAKWMGGRIPTAEEVRSIYSHVDHLRTIEADRELKKKIPAVNGHLLNDGVEESPPSQQTSRVGSSPELFTNLQDANVGFAHWHPVAVTGHGNRLAGQGEMGGVWEWTSSPLERHEGFEPMPLYPLYTADFFDGKHNIVLGGSWATHPRIAGRKSFVNWYQRNYPYAWCGARLVRDL